MRAKIGHSGHPVTCMQPSHDQTDPLPNSPQNRGSCVHLPINHIHPFSSEPCWQLLRKVVPGRTFMIRLLSSVTLDSEV